MGDDTLIGGDGDDTLDGGAGDDRLETGYGNAILSGGAGNDTYVVSYSGIQIVETAGGGIDTVETESGFTLTDNVENLTITSAYGATGIGNALANVITGGTGDDWLEGVAGADTVDGGAGDDTIRINAVADLVAGDVMRGGEGTDTLYLTDGVDISPFAIGTDIEKLYSSGTVSLTAGQLSMFEAVDANRVAITTAGICDLTDATVHTAEFNLAVGGVTLDVAGESWSTHTVNGSAGADDVSASGYYAYLYGYDGDDRLTAATDYAWIDGGAGNDILAGGDGSDTLTGGLGADTLTGGGGGDYFRYDGVADSTGAAYDMLAEVDFAQDRLSLGVWVATYAGLSGGALSMASFDADLAGIATADRLGNYTAMLVEAESGDLDGALFIVADANGIAGYQAGADYVIRVDPVAVDTLSTAFFV
jgi:serralysin